MGLFIGKGGVLPLDEASKPAKGVEPKVTSCLNKQSLNLPHSGGAS